MPACPKRLQHTRSVADLAACLPDGKDTICYRIPGFGSDTQALPPKGIRQNAWQGPLAMFSHYIGSIAPLTGPTQQLLGVRYAVTGWLHESVCT